MIVDRGYATGIVEGLKIAQQVVEKEVGNYLETPLGDRTGEKAGRASEFLIDVTNELDKNIEMAKVFANGWVLA